MNKIVIFLHGWQKITILFVSYLSIPVTDIMLMIQITFRDLVYWYYVTINLKQKIIYHLALPCQEFHLYKSNFIFHQTKKIVFLILEERTNILFNIEEKWEPPKTIED